MGHIVRFFLTVLIIIIFASSVDAQRTLNGKVILKDQSDTLRLPLLVRINTLYWPETLDELSFYRKISYLDSHGKRETFNESQIDYLEVVDYDGYKRVFVSGKYTGILRIQGQLVEKKAEGKINWYRRYYPHGYDGSLMFLDYFIKGNEAPVKVDWLNNMRKKLMKLTSDHPNSGEIFYELDFSDPYQIIKWYNAEI